MKRPFIISLVLWGVLGIATALSAQMDTSTAQRDTSEVRPTRVVVGVTTIFTYTQRLGPLSPQERAQRLQALLDRLVRDPALDVTRISARDRGTETDIVLGDLVLMTLTEADAQGVTRNALTAQVVETLQRVLKSEAEDYSFRSLMIDAGLALLFTLIFALFLKVAKRGFGRVHAGLESQRGREGALLSLRGVELLTWDTLVDLLEEPVPFVLQTSLDDFYVSYQINAYTDKPNLMARIYSDLHQNIQDKFNEGGVEIMSPHYSTLRDGNQTTIPENYLPRTYEPSAFRVSATNSLFNRPNDRPSS